LRAESCSGLDFRRLFFDFFGLFRTFSYFLRIFQRVFEKYPPGIGVKLMIFHVLRLFRRVFEARKIPLSREGRIFLDRRKSIFDFLGVGKQGGGMGGGPKEDRGGGGPPLENHHKKRPFFVIKNLFFSS
jgi:hypothetical protein